MSSALESEEDLRAVNVLADDSVQRLEGVIVLLRRLGCAGLVEALHLSAIVSTMS